MKCYFPLGVFSELLGGFGGLRKQIELLSDSYTIRRTRASLAIVFGQGYCFTTGFGKHKDWAAI